MPAGFFFYFPAVFSYIHMQTHSPGLLVFAYITRMDICNQDLRCGQHLESSWYCYRHTLVCALIYTFTSHSHCVVSVLCLGGTKGTAVEKDDLRKTENEIRFPLPFFSPPPTPPLSSPWLAGLFISSWIQS